MNPENNKSNYNTTVSGYKKQEILMSTPEQCVLHTYDIAIQSCARKESLKAGRAVAALVDALNFDTDSDLASQLFRLYQYCINLIHRQEFENPIKILKELRETWQKVMANQAAA